ncbi:helix-turn-helix domain-containing protein [Sulfitobacter sp.]|uniref:helix-turn-helix domain-containing protein n=1 Tax=Sulfitobacter sp. TaxID=1903071 RepID=UPI003298E3A8
MSALALIWAANVKGLKPAAKVTLVQLADFHNKETGQCNPSTKRLADDCEMGRATLFRHLKTLEEAGLITRHANGDGRGGRGSNQYELHIDVALGASSNRTTKPKNAIRVASQNDTGGNISKLAGKCLKSRTMAGPNRDTNLTIEPEKEPVCATDVPQCTNLKFEEFWETHPNPKNRDRSEELFAQAVSGGTDPEAIIAGSKAYAAENTGNAKQYIAHSHNWLKAKRWEDFKVVPAKTTAASHALACKIAEHIIGRKSWVANTVSSRKANELIAAGLVSVKQCKAAGIAL